MYLLSYGHARVLCLLFFPTNQCFVLCWWYGIGCFISSCFVMLQPYTLFNRLLRAVVQACTHALQNTSSIWQYIGMFQLPQHKNHAHFRADMMKNWKPKPCDRLAAAHVPKVCVPTVIYVSFLPSCNRGFFHCTLAHYIHCSNITSSIATTYVYTCTYSCSMCTHATASRQLSVKTTSRSLWHHNHETRVESRPNCCNTQQQVESAHYPAVNLFPLLFTGHTHP